MYTVGYCIWSGGHCPHSTPGNSSMNIIYIYVAHTLDGTHTDCPVMAYSFVYTFVASKCTEIEIYKVKQGDRQTDSFQQQQLQCTLLCCDTQQNETHLSHADTMNE